MIYLLSAALAATPSQHDLLLGRFHAHFSETEADDGPDCLTGLVRDLKENWGLFTPAERAEMTAMLAPWKHDLLDAIETPTPPPPPGGAPTDTCAGQQGSHRILGSHFSVEWDTSQVSDSTAEKFLDALETAHDVEIDQLGWRPPAGDDRYLMRAYIAQGNYASAYTTVERCGGSYVPYIYAYAGSFSGGDWYETMALHEFNHSSQFSYGYSPEFWIWEATATYIEEQVAPNNNWWSTYVAGYSAHPEMAINAESQSDYDTFYHMYGMAIWFFHAEQYGGDTDSARQMWEWAADHGSYYDVNVQDMADGIGLDFEGELYPDFVARNAAMEYSEHRYYTAVDEVDSVNELPATGESSNRTEPGGYGQNYIRIKDNAGDGTSTLKVEFHSDDNVDWLVQLVEVTDEAVQRVENATGKTDVSVSLAQFGDHDVFLAVSPTKHTNSSSYAYSWSASLVEGGDTETTDPGTTDPGTTDPGTTDDGNGDGDGTGSLNLKDATSCGCASTPGTPAGVLLLGVAAVLVGRRRRA